MYIEDNTANLKLMKKILQPFGTLSLIFANCGKEGLQIAFNERI
ncbi:hypothetical protein B4119_2317 [Parageobacillus caldoxylosilyticus]|uniref:Uncharacterized protein n=1 Tax=Saccharococcus caldoxylosilyticus TaxID=81408 RepID=A0A150LVI2_9BACL|nr:hypothetical protein B4119_2317 [Parageobacillus caldoxylosilyticus]